MTHRVRSSSHPAGQPVVGADAGSPPNVDPNTLVKDTQSRYGLNEPGLSKLSGTPPVVDSRFAERGDPVLRRYMAEVLVRAFGLTLSQIDEPGAKEAGTPPSLRRP